MIIDDRIAAAETLLRARGAAEVGHPGGTLLEHLARVRALLAEWDAADVVQFAGLCHAAYGTDGFDAALLHLDERALLAATIGAEAEQVVYLYGSCDRGKVYPQLAQPVVTFTDRFTGRQHTLPALVLQAFVEITAANELDLVRHNREFAERHGAGLAALFAGAAQHLSVPARQAWSGI